MSMFSLTTASAAATVSTAFSDLISSTTTTARTRAASVLNGASKVTDAGKPPRRNPVRRRSSMGAPHIVKRKPHSRISSVVLDSATVYQAIDNANLETIELVRNHAFQLLLTESLVNDKCPLMYAMTKGPSHEAVALFIVNNFVKWDPTTSVLTEACIKRTTKRMHSHLKAALQSGLSTSDPSNGLISSLLQAYAMVGPSDVWIAKQVSSIAVAFKDAGKPVEAASLAVKALVLKACGEELYGKAMSLRGVLDYYANVTEDLLLLAAWYILECDGIVAPGDDIPLNCFARDDCLNKNFWEKIARLEADVYERISPSFRTQLKHLKCVLDLEHWNPIDRIEELRLKLDS